MTWITIVVAALSLWILIACVIATYRWPFSLTSPGGGCSCDHPPHPPGHCEAIDGGWNPHNYCWCPEKLAPVMRGDSAVVSMQKDLESLGIRTPYGSSRRARDREV